MAAPLAAPADRRAFTYRHLITFEETNLVGNVYFARHLSWQGRCREHFLRQHAPSILRELGDDLRLVTLRVACDYFEEFLAFDEVEMQMRLTHAEQHRIGLAFDYYLHRDGERRLAARGFQETGCLRQRSDGRVNPIAPPPELLEALEEFS